MKYGFRIVLIFFASFLLFILFYLATAFICSHIQVNESTTKSGIVSIYVKSNGVHTDLVVPVKWKNMDWSTIFPFKNTKGQDSTSTLLALGWGDKGFYLNTPTWGDLTFSTACKAMFGLSTSALHTTYLDTIEVSSTCKKISMTQHEYYLLVRYIKRTISTKKGSSIFIPTNAVYGKNDAFYEANGSYHFFSTCNTWTNGALKHSQKKACFWTPFDTGILNQYP
jgi:uncharacterized protein (TIGR02117 family)